MSTGERNISEHHTEQLTVPITQAESNPGLQSIHPSIYNPIAGEEPAAQISKLQQTDIRVGTNKKKLG